MRLHEDKKVFDQLVALTSVYKHIPERAVRKDYFIMLILERLSQSTHRDHVVFKGGTSLSKCFPGSIERFSEDIDLTFVPKQDENLSNPQYSKRLKEIERILLGDNRFEPISDERTERSKSVWVWLDHETDRIKLEIGSSVRPEPVLQRPCISYIHEFLLAKGFSEDVNLYEMKEITINVLSITRTFVDKLMAIKRHALCGTLSTKVRHLYDVYRLFQMEEIQTFLDQHDELRRVVRLTKQTDVFYLSCKNCNPNYRPDEPYGYSLWAPQLDQTIRARYERLHEDLLYTDEKQSFDDALKVLADIDAVLCQIGE